MEGNGDTKVNWRAFPTSAALAEALAGEVADRLRAGLKSRGAASIAVSGGSTPGLFFDALSRQQLDWANVVVTLVDERFVPETSPRSNAALVKARLLANEARLARFVSLWADAESVDAAARRAAAGQALVPAPLDVAVLGMGLDGHTASFFPDANELDALLDPACPALVMPVRAPSAGEPRLTLPASRLADARFLALHIEGHDKKQVLETALRGCRSPIAMVMAQARAPMPVYWTEGER